MADAAIEQILRHRFLFHEFKVSIQNISSFVSRWRDEMIGGKKAAGRVPDMPFGLLQSIDEQRNGRLVTEHKINRNTKVLAAGQDGGCHFLQ